MLYFFYNTTTLTTIKWGEGGWGEVEKKGCCSLFSGHAPSVSTVLSMIEAGVAIHFLVNIHAQTDISLKIDFIKKYGI